MQGFDKSAEELGVVFPDKDKTASESNPALRKSLSALLKSFGFETDGGDEALLDRAVAQAEGYIRHELNIEYLTLNLAEPMLNIAAGEFLREKKTAAPEKLKSIDLTPAVKRIEVGDTNTEFAVGGGSLTPEQRFDLFTEYLIKSGKRQLFGYRRIKW